MLAVLPATLLSFAPSGVRPLPGLATRMPHAPAMVLDGAAQLLADAAILLPDAGQAQAAAAAASAVAETADPSWFDL